MAKASYRVISIEDGRQREDIQFLETDARTERGFMRAFYQRWPSAPRGCFYAELGDGRVDFYTKLNPTKTAYFILEDGKPFWPAGN